MRGRVATLPRIAFPVLHTAPPAMPTPQERQALLFLAVVAFLGAGARAANELSAREPVPAAAGRALAAQLAAVEGKQQARKARTGAGRARPAAGTSGARAPSKGKGNSPPPNPVDVDRASVSELQVLPRIGPALAARIVAHRDSAGPFGSLEALQRVRGVGPAMVRELAPHVTFSGTPRPMSAARTPHRRASQP